MVIAKTKAIIAMGIPNDPTDKYETLLVTNVNSDKKKPKIKKYQKFIFLDFSIFLPSFVFCTNP